MSNASAHVVSHSDPHDNQHLVDIHEVLLALRAAGHVPDFISSWQSTRNWRPDSGPASKA